MKTERGIRVDIFSKSENYILQNENEELVATCAAASSRCCCMEEPLKWMLNQTHENKGQLAVEHESKADTDVHM